LKIFAGTVLTMLKKQRQNGLLHQGNYIISLFSPNLGGHKYDGRQREIETAIAESWNWLEVQGLLVAAPGQQAGWRIFSRKAERLDSTEDLKKFAASRNIPKNKLHPRSADKVFSAFMRAEFDTAVFHAMRAVEVYVREACGYPDGEIGTKLVRRAFHEEDGPLTDKTVEVSERQGRSALFAGAIGSYKNPHSHRDIDIDNADEALEIVMFANHLLRIVDRRVEENRKPKD
jgi:uncharacterized protein (TIGR02391 family)